MTITVRTIFSINATDRSHDFLVIRRGPAGISIEAQSREDEWESATAGPFTPEQLRAALDEVAPAGSYTRTDEPDDMDGGVTAALIEKEAEQRACPDLDAHWRLDEAMDRAERAERERDEWKDSAIKAMADLERAEHPRPLTPDTITDEARDRAYRAVAALSVCDWDDMSGVAKGRAMALVATVIAEITRPEPPARPEWEEEGAKALTVAVWGMEIPSEAGEAGDKLAFSLARHGYKVVPVSAEEQP